MPVRVVTCTQGCSWQCSSRCACQNLRPGPPAPPAAGSQRPHLSRLQIHPHVQLQVLGHWLVERQPAVLQRRHAVLRHRHSPELYLLAVQLVGGQRREFGLGQPLLWPRRRARCMLLLPFLHARLYARHGGRLLQDVILLAGLFGDLGHGGAQAVLFPAAWVRCEP